MKDEKALQQQALDKAATRVKESAAVLAKGMDVRLGALIYVSNQFAAVPRPMMRAGCSAGSSPGPGMGLSSRPVRTSTPSPGSTATVA